jgi:hypothetical protein
MPNDKTTRTMTAAQRAYEEKRAARAGMGLDKWLDSKRRQQEEQARAVEAVKPKAKTAKAPGFFSRLMERAHKPL